MGVTPVESDRYSELLKPKRYVAPFLWALSIITAVITYQYINPDENIAAVANNIWALLIVNLLLFALLAGVYARRIIVTLTHLKKRSQNTGLKKRMMWAFGLVTMVPTLLVSLFAFFFFNLGIQAWFDDRVQTGLSESVTVAEAYLKEHKESLRADALAMATDISRAGALSISNPTQFNRFVDRQAQLRLLTEVIVFRQNRIIAQGRLSFALAFENIPSSDLERADTGEIVTFTDDTNNKVRALVRIEGMPGSYLLVGRLIDSRVLQHVEETQGAHLQYTELFETIGEKQFIFSIVFLMFVLLLLLGALWYALVFATKLTAPITELGSAAERIRGGDYSVRIDTPDRKEADEVDVLSLAFNRMAEQLEAQRGDLITANRNLDERRRFSEAVLAGVSSSVIALNQHFEITLANRSAETLLLSEGDSIEALVGKTLSTIIPDMQDMLTDFKENPTQQVRGEIQFSQGDERLILHARITSEVLDDTIIGYIATFDDITPLISAQRQAAWSDVARRIAHEIKNPLTPIGLAAQRLKKKYSEAVGEEEQDNFKRYVDTIEHHVGNIGRMVEEFVQFARIPTPEFALLSINDLVKKAIFTEKVSHPDIRYKLDLSTQDTTISGDGRLLSQLLVNLLKNAAEAMQDIEGDKQISIATELTDGRVTLTIADSGKGVPEDQIENIFEPYVTTREKGTGLGLAISKKIVEDHKGSIRLANHPDGGAVVSLSFGAQNS